MPLTPKEEESVVENTFALDCPWLQLKAQSPEKSSYVGSGAVSLNDEGFFEVKLLSPDPLSIGEAMPEHWPIGEVLGREYYYTLEARDFKGRVFGAEGLLPMRHTGPGGTVIYAKAWSVTLTEEAEERLEKSYLRVVFPKEVRFPANTLVSEEKLIGGQRETLKRRLSAATFLSCGIEFQIEFEAATGTTTISAASNEIVFDETTVNCIIDAFAFITASMEPWSIVQTWTKHQTETRIRSRGFAKRRSRIGPPLSTSLPGDDVWKLFDRYLAFGLDSSDESRHPLASYVRAVLTSGASVLDVEELVLSVTIESLLREQFSFLPLEHENLDTQIEAITDLLNAQDHLDETFRRRLFGALQAMKSPRAKDRLMALMKRSLIDENFVKTYGTFRGKSAHGVGVNWAEIESHIHQSNAMLVLFYQLVFLKIGYQGPYIDYGSSGYPERRFEADLNHASKDLPTKT
jgi:hypothetical protein